MASSIATSPFASVQRAVRFANDSAGLEKTLRFLQSLAQIAAAYTLSSAEAASWLQARKQLALGRRYLRFLKFIDAFGFAYNAFTTSTGLPMLLQVGKWSCLGVYLILETSTIMDAMGVWSTRWAPLVFVEAMKFWFYSLVFSILSSLVQLVQLYTEPDPLPERSQKLTRSERRAFLPVATNVRTRERRIKARNLVRKAVTDGFDLFIPGSTTGWIITSSGTVGIASAFSTLLASKEVWARI